ncbi:hypothetical protein CYMTET_9535 [Cymbomonas tetramitiformis]|uniref:Uncharacterized protein n=1 Tax=Cymbomonas tetramitiformis TaxID=36881 RepID=A0AAE0GSJ4_9CHLO|nr:hypothetical protein CYMTET_9535 [Cymbomonas tetramitiformis]
MHFKELVQETEFLKALCDLRAWCESVDTVAANGREVMLTDEGYIKYVKVHVGLCCDFPRHGSNDLTDLVPERTVEHYGLKHYLYAFEWLLRDPKVDGVALRACYDYVMRSLCECVKEKSVVSSRTFTVAYYWFRVYDEVCEPRSAQIDVERCKHAVCGGPLRGTQPLMWF